MSCQSIQLVYCIFSSPHLLDFSHLIHSSHVDPRASVTSQGFVDLDPHGWGWGGVGVGVGVGGGGLAVSHEPSMFIYEVNKVNGKTAAYILRGNVSFSLLVLLIKLLSMI